MTRNSQLATLLKSTPYGFFNYQLGRKVGLTTSLVLMRLCDGQAQYGEGFYLTQEQIASDTMLSARTVRREIKKLQKMELLEIIKRETENCNRYSLNSEAIRELTLVEGDPGAGE